MKPIQLPEQTPEQLQALDTLYRTTKDVRLRQRTQLAISYNLRYSCYLWCCFRRRRSNWHLCWDRYRRYH